MINIAKRKTIVAIFMVLVLTSIAHLLTTANISINYISKYALILDPPKPTTKSDIDLLLEILPIRGDKTVSTYYEDSRSFLKRLGELGEAYLSTFLRTSNVILFEASLNGRSMHVFVILDYGPHFENLTANTLYITSYDSGLSASSTKVLVLNPGREDVVVVKVDKLEQAPQ